MAWAAFAVSPVGVTVLISTSSRYSIAYELLGGIILRPEGQWRCEGAEKDAGAQGMVGHISSAFYCRLCQAASRMVATP